MENNPFIEEIKNRFAEKIVEVTEHNPLRITLTIDPASLTVLAGVFLSEKNFRFIIASGLHTKKGFEILYHFSNDSEGHVINVHVVLPHENPVVDSLTKLLSGAEWIEREIHELLGIEFKGHPNMVPLISEGNWPEGTYPYRKDFKS
ncbi:MAG: NADH-quinone oxidoreductase subunit C [Bacteroidales bacterium]|nr:NADH-quinone oxidoreductase subunit C [Bacteroidales bacterium]MCF8336353.1 NADH-quinone oxidoreductase subunit C [Bacteroidales bacterium]